MIIDWQSFLESWKMLLTYTWVVIVQVYPCVNINQAGFFMHFEVDTLGTSLVGQWLRICLPVQGKWVQSLVQEDPTCATHVPELRKPTRSRATTMRSLSN